MYPKLVDIDKYGPNVYKDTQHKNDFWKDVPNAYKYFYYGFKPETSEEVMAEPIHLFFSKLQLDNKVILIKSLVNKGLYSIQHFYN